LKAGVDTRLPQLVPPADQALVVGRAMHEAATSPGKRLRPALVLLVAEAFGASSAPARRRLHRRMVHGARWRSTTGCMDDAELRRGRPTLHRQFGEAVAVLAAFALLGRAQSLLPDALATAGVVPAHRATLIRRLAEVVETMCHGQALDLGAVRPARTLDDLEAIHAGKTGALFVLAAEFGAVAAGITDSRLEALRAYARNLGLAFQVGDDLLDASSSRERLGKPAGRDRALGRVTFVSLLGPAGAATIRDELLNAAVGTLGPLGDGAVLLASLADHVRTRTA
jgi:geranylgeranyl pyrophosphate synthase